MVFTIVIRSPNQHLLVAIQLTWPGEFELQPQFVNIIIITILFFGPEPEPFFFESCLISVVEILSAPSMAKKPLVFRRCAIAVVQVEGLS